MDTRFWQYYEGEVLQIPPIKELCKTLEAKFILEEKTIKSLQKENEYLKSEHYKDEELKKLKEENARLKDDLTRGFRISKLELKKILEWKNGLDKQPNRCFHYEFHPTSIGYVGYILDNFGNKFQFHSI